MVSHKRSLHRQSGRAYAHDIEENVVRWERVWVSPLSIPSSATSSGPVKANGTTSTQKLNSDTETAEKLPTFSFKVKVWAQLNNSTESVVLKDGDDDDYINLVATTQSRKDVPSQANAGSLTAADIRGAVGGGEEVSISSYTSNEAKPKDKTIVAAAETEKTMEVISEEPQNDNITTEKPVDVGTSETPAENSSEETTSGADNASKDKETENPVEENASKPDTDEITAETSGIQNSTASIVTKDITNEEEPKNTVSISNNELKPAEELKSAENQASDNTNVSDVTNEPSNAKETPTDTMPSEDIEIGGVPVAESKEDEKLADISKDNVLKNEKSTTEIVIPSETTDIEMKDAPQEVTSDNADAKSSESADVDMKDS
ncbi:hypothetical protein D0Z03_002030 [Geotrichum reessii]|nr:hypothetical protein D0Z03_002030 [Galactomyces reessii]